MRAGVAPDPNLYADADADADRDRDSNFDARTDPASNPDHPAYADGCMRSCRRWHVLSSYRGTHNGNVR
jgi:hypothetical protein